MRNPIPRRRRLALLAVPTAAMALVSAVWVGSASSGTEATRKTIRVAIVGNPQMEDIAKLTPSLFTKKTGIKVQYSILEEGKLREIVTRDVGVGRQAVRRRHDRHVRGAAVRRQRPAQEP